MVRNEGKIKALIEAITSHSADLHDSDRAEYQMLMTGLVRQNCDDEYWVVELRGDAVVEFAELARHDPQLRESAVLETVCLLVFELDHGNYRTPEKLAVELAEVARLVIR
jgi:hypothetical protein